MGVRSEALSAADAVRNPTQISLDSWNLMSSAAARDKIVQRMMKVVGQVSSSCRTVGEGDRAGTYLLPFSCDLARTDTCVTYGMTGLNGDTLGCAKQDRKR
jgi:hypothetical protein